MGAQSSRNHEDDYFVNNIVPLIHAISTSTRSINEEDFIWKAWSGRTLYATIDGQERVFLVDYCLFLRWTSDTEIGKVKKIARLTINTFWPDGYPNTALKDHNPLTMTDTVIELEKYPSVCYIDLLRNAASSSPALATPQEKAALSGLVSESLCIALQVLLSTGAITYNQTVKLDAIGATRREKLSIDNIPHATPEERQYALRDYYAKYPAKLTVEQELMIIEKIAKTEVVVRIYEHMGFTKTDRIQSPISVKMQSSVDVLMHRCRAKYAV